MMNQYFTGRRDFLRTMTALGAVATLLAMDRTTLTAAFKVLERRGLVESLADRHDCRNRRLRLSPAGRDLLKRAVPVWRAEHDALDAALAGQGIALASRFLVDRDLAAGRLVQPVAQTQAAGAMIDADDQGGA